VNLLQTEAKLSNAKRSLLSQCLHAKMSVEEATEEVRETNMEVPRKTRHFSCQLSCWC